MGYATTSTGHRECVRKSGDSRTVRAMWINGWYAVLRQTSTTVEETWSGLKKSDAETLVANGNSETSTLNSTTRNYLGGATVKQSAGVSSWMSADGCWGTKVVTSMNVVGDTDLYDVTRTTTTMTVSGNGAVLTLY